MYIYEYAKLKFEIWILIFKPNNTKCTFQTLNLQSKSTRIQNRNKDLKSKIKILKS